ncbi:MAG: nitrogen fixation protein NifQ [Alphaproteobacteria bacterium]|nr:nitrogen fixation protein NifQ [Alphaproteobacteria bacterium]MBF0249383.1 nitrogen fixation protein NifQ [Alphaproteobacteria bacterium]
MRHAVWPSVFQERPRRRMLARARGHGNDAAFAAMALNARRGENAMGGWMGLGAGQFRHVMRLHFPRARVPVGVRTAIHRPKTRSMEWSELRRLLRRHRAGRDVSELFMADIVCSACLGSDHLWQDLGLFNRGELTSLMRRNFPSLAERNTRDMKWKKFLYKQLCIAEGVYVCRAPSCEECADYDACFGPES